MLEIACGQCEVLWMRWTADTDRPFDVRAMVPAEGILELETPGWRQDGWWMNFRSGGVAAGPLDLADVARLGDGSRWTFTCPTSGCRSSIPVHVDKLVTAATTVLRHLYETRTTLPPVTVASLLRLLP